MKFGHEHAQIQMKCPRIALFGQVSGELDVLDIDSQYYLQPSNNDGSYYVRSVDQVLKTPYALASFYADCLAFEQDLATLALPALDNFSPAQVPWTFKPVERDDVPDLYVEQLLSAVDYAVTANDGIWFMAILTNTKQDVQEGALHFEEHYGQIDLAVHLYNAALRQPDQLSQYLNFYRVIESISGGNGKYFLSRLLRTNLEYQRPTFAARMNAPLKREHEKLVNPRPLGKAGIIVSDPIEYPYYTLEEALPADVYKYVRQDKVEGPYQMINIMEIRRAEAIARLNAFNATNRRGDSAMIDRLYSENRCGIVHGRNIKHHDFGNDFQELMSDLKLLRYLERLAIEQASY